MTLQRGPLFLGFLLATLVCAAALAVLDAPLHTSAAPSGIVSFELAWSVESADTMLRSWDTKARISAACLQGLDYLFLCLYSLTLALGCLQARDKFRARGWRLASAGVVLAWLSLVAGACDAIENAPLAMMVLSGEARSPLPQVAAIFATIKFALVLVGLLYWLAGFLARPPRE
jgi:hypothetical protein